MTNMDSRVVLVFVLVAVCVELARGASRQPNIRDHIHCKMQFANEWEEVMQTTDPYSVVESYYDLHGSPCKTPCRLRSNANPALTTLLGEKNSPNYEICGSNNKV